ncbi:YggS family pyridoxal phosphate-dependent enzyme [Neorhodopirellula pilleata]|nr:YggS family pyridoxal phosphate-dependent enzyme [Neorhodopirellula pilleata]
MAAQPISSEQMRCGIEEAKSRIAENWHEVRASVADAARAAGRDADSVRIVGVAKYVDATITQWLVDAGCVELGENRPQSLIEKSGVLDGPIRWHQIGHLQRNKVRRLLSAEPVIHSVDSQRLLDEIHCEASQQARSVDVLIEVNVSDEDAKTGLPIEQAEAVLRQLVESRDSQSGEPGARIIGLMAMAGWGTTPDQAQRQFAKLRGLRDQLQTAVGIPLPELSMGMSGDYPAAIAEGATLVRIGSSLFSGVLP